MEINQGELKVYNPNKEISREVVLDAILRHRDACKQADTGEILNNDKPIDHLEKKMNQVRALTLIILAQKAMINISRSVILFRSRQDWYKKNRSEEEQKQNPFERFECDYKEIMEWKNFLSNCQMAIIEADRTASLEDDFVIEKTDNKGEKFNELTTNFYEMKDDLEDSYEAIYLIMMKNKIVSSGMEEDEELTDKQKEEEMMSRIEEA